MEVCQINQSWKHYDSYSLASSYSAHLLARWSNTPVVGTRLKKWRTTSVMFHLYHYRINKRTSPRAPVCISDVIIWCNTWIKLIVVVILCPYLRYSTVDHVHYLGFAPRPEFQPAPRRCPNQLPCLLSKAVRAGKVLPITGHEGPEGE